MKNRKVNTCMKIFTGFLSLVFATASWGQEDPIVSNKSINVSTQLSLEKDKATKVNIELSIDVNSGTTYDEAWVNKKVKKAKENGYQVQYVVMGETTGAKTFAEAKEMFEHLRNMQGQSVMESANEMTESPEHKKKVRTISAITATVASGTTVMAISAGLGYEHSTLMLGALAWIVYYNWTLRDKAYSALISEHGKLTPQFESKRLSEIADHLMTFSKQVPFGIAAGFTIQVAARYAVYGLDYSMDWARLFVDTSLISSMGLAYRYFWKKTQLDYAKMKVKEDVKNIRPMELYRMHTSLGFNSVFGLVQQLILFGAPVVSYKIFGSQFLPAGLVVLGAGGLYTYYRNPELMPKAYNATMKFGKKMGEKLSQLDLIKKFNAMKDKFRATASSPAGGQCRGLFSY